MASNAGKHLSISVKKFGDGKPVDVNDRSNQWSSYDDALRAALELAIQNYISGKAKGLDLPHVDVASKWLLQPKSLQFSLEASNGYPSLLQNEDDDDADESRSSAFQIAQPRLPSFKSFILLRSRRVRPRMD